MSKHAREHSYRLRPPSKIHKSVPIALRQVAAGAVGMCCSTLFEAETMAAGGVEDIMLFTTVVTGPKLARLALLNRSIPSLSVVTDHMANVEQLERAASESGRPMLVLIEYEIGAGRTGIASEEGAVTIARRIADSDWLQFGGVQGYVGRHQATADYDERRRQSEQYVRPLRALAERLRRAGLPPRIVTGGGTGTHDIDPDFGVFSEIQAGSYVFGDVHYRNTVMRRDDPSPFRESLHVYASVISTAKAGFAITDAGAKELNGFSGPIKPVLTGGAHPGSEYTIVGDDMGRIDFPHPVQRLEIGDIVQLLPPLCFQTIVHHQAYHCVRADRLVDIWPIDALPSW